MTATMTEYEDYLELEDEAHEHEDYLELEDEGEFEDEYEQEDFLGGLVSSVLGGELTGPLSEQEELELASELLEVSTEQELEQFIGKLVGRAVKGVRNFARSKAGKALGGVLKGVAKKALPVVGGALGSMVAPGIGTAIGSKLGSLASGLFEFEQEINQQELEFEMARRFVRIGATAARRASAQTSRGVPPMTAARRAVLSATKAHAPAALQRGRRTPQRFRTRRPATTGQRRRGPRGGYRRGGTYGYDRPVESTNGDAYDQDGFPQDDANGQNGGPGERGQWVRKGGNIVLIGA
ncbi:MAG TPA: hypothetical protein VFV67_23680 [Actinophytocola sp.]|uniref:hypothetical protein n=1 Tax=Actinophytocola sp. TaxID=1872138 RepID=UPI002DB9A0E2|nr:hypothetical protein [Actinophytocola sp.]HEU5473659.1 hypothetical protein [Actinophytocola sp.]